MMAVLIGLSGFVSGLLMYLAVQFDKKKGLSLKKYILESSCKIDLVLYGVLSSVFSIVFYRFYGAGGQFASYSFMALILSASSIVDMRTRIIPDRIVMSGGIAALIFIFVNDDLTILRALLGGALAGGIFLIISLATKGGIGMGDVKLLGCTGLFLGIERVLTAILISVLLSGLVGVVLFILNAKNRKRTMPFAPFILTGAVLAVII